MGLLHGGKGDQRCYLHQLRGVQLQEGQVHQERWIWTKGRGLQQKTYPELLQHPQKDSSRGLQDDVHRYCEKFSNIFPFPVEEQNCHFEPKKICELEMKTRPKKAKKYSYTKDCKEQ